MEDLNEIAQKLHDKVGANLSAVKMFYAVADDYMVDAVEEDINSIKKANQIIDQCCSDIREIYQQLIKLNLKEIIMDLRINESESITLSHIEWLGFYPSKDGLVRKNLEGQVKEINGEYHYYVNNKHIKRLRIRKDLNDIVAPISNEELRKRNLKAQNR